MDKRKRRLKKRLEAQLRREISGSEPPKESLPAHIEHKESPTLLRRGLEVFRKAISGTAVLLSLVLAGLGWVSYYALLWPHVSVEPDLLLIPGDPFSTQFSVTNDNVVFDVKNLRPTCRTIYLITIHNFAVSGMPPRPSPAIPVLGARQKTTINCLPIVSGFGGFNELRASYIEIDITYKQEWWFREMPQSFIFKGAMDSQKAVHWTHITPEQLRADLSQL